MVFFGQQFKDNVKVFKLALDLVQSLNHYRLSFLHGEPAWGCNNHLQPKHHFATERRAVSL